MRLALARLCLDCEEVHDGDKCRVCGSETFAFLRRWVEPTSRPSHKVDQQLRRDVPAGEHAERLDAYRQLLDSKHKRSHPGRLLARGAALLAILGAARVVWRWGRRSR